MGGCCSNERAVRQREGLSEEQTDAVLQRTPTLISPKVLYHLIKLDTAVNADALSSRESFQNIQVNFSVIWALLLGVAGGGVLEEKPEASWFPWTGEPAWGEGDFTTLGTIWCFSFVCFMMATLQSLFFIIMTVSIPNDEEFHHWIKLLGWFPVKYPIYIGFAGIFALLYCVAENMSVGYDFNYTFICLGKCFALGLGPMLYVPYKMTWAAIVVNETATEIGRAGDKLRPTSAQSIREFLVTDYFEKALQCDVTKLSREDFMGRFEGNHEKSDFLLKLAGRLYDDFEAAKIEEMLGGKDQASSKPKDVGWNVNQVLLAPASEASRIGASASPEFSPLFPSSQNATDAVVLMNTPQYP